MPGNGYERLSALDTAFLALETPHSPMHVTLTSIFESGPLRTEEGGVDFDRIVQWIESILPQVPRYRQRLDWVPIQQHPVWVDDPSFDLQYHLRHTSLPRQGGVHHLKRLAARVMAQPLDREKPLWEIWVVEGLEGDRFALVTKVHHCMIDGASGVALFNNMLSNAPDQQPVAKPYPFVPRPVPSGRALLLDEVRRSVRLPWQALKGFPSALREILGTALDTRRVRSLLEETIHALRLPAATVLNGPVGSYRRYDWMATDLAEVGKIRKSLGGSLNDVVLATVAGAVRRVFEARGLDPSDIQFCVGVPVNVRAPSEDTSAANRISAWLVDLPIGEPNPRERFGRIAARTAELKASNQAVATDGLIQSTEWLPGPVFEAAVRAAGKGLPCNLIVTNVPGPPTPWYLVGARMLEMYGTVPLTGKLALGMALGSYAGRLFWAFVADWELGDELDAFVEAIRISYAELRDAARSAPSPPKPGVSPRARAGPRSQPAPPAPGSSVP